MLRERDRSQVKVDGNKDAYCQQRVDVCEDHVPDSSLRSNNWDVFSKSQLTETLRELPKLRNAYSICPQLQQTFHPPSVTRSLTGDIAPQTS